MNKYYEILKKDPELKLKSVDVDDPIYTEVDAYPFPRAEREQALLKLANGVLTEMIGDGSYPELCRKSSAST